MERRSRGRAGAWLASLCAHALLGLALCGLPESPQPDPPPQVEVEAVELVWLDEVPGPSGSAREPDPSAPSQTPEPAEPPAGDVAAAPQRPAAPTAPRKHPVRPSSPGVPPTSSVPKPSGEGGLSLSGLRGSSGVKDSGPASAVPSTALVRPPSAPKGRRPDSAVLGPVALSADTEPRSLEEAGFRKRKDGSYKFGGISSPFVAVVRPDGRVRFRDRVVTVQGTSVHTNFVPAQKLAGEEQFRTLKTQILRQTADLRMQMARSWSKKQIRAQLAALSTQLKTAWERPSWSLERRRKTLFLLWDECEEPPGDEAGVRNVEDTLDQARTAAGAKARAMIVRFIREELPADSDEAYPAAELRALNGIRVSRQRFAPYAAR